MKTIMNKFCLCLHILLQFTSVKCSASRRQIQSFQIGQEKEWEMEKLYEIKSNKFFVKSRERWMFPQILKHSYYELSKKQKSELSFKHWETRYDSSQFSQTLMNLTIKRCQITDHFSIGYDTCQINLEVSGEDKLALIQHLKKSY